jgi:hypothetical protein
MDYPPCMNVEYGVGITGGQRMDYQFTSQLSAVKNELTYMRLADCKSQAPFTLLMWILSTPIKYLLSVCRSKAPGS